MSLLGGFKPSVARDIANQTIDDGLIQRLCPIMLGPATLGKDIDCSGPTAAYQGLVQRLVELREAFGGVVLFTPEAQTIRRQYEQRHLDLMSDCEGIYPKLASHIGKYDGIFARLCLLWYLIERPGDVITASIAETLADVFASRGS